MVTATQFPVQQTPWDSQGKRLSDVRSMREAMELANLDFGVETTKAYMRTGDITDEIMEEALLDFQPRTVSDYRELVNNLMGKCFSGACKHNIIRREDNHKVFGVCKERWEPLQNIEAFDWFQPALDNNLVTLNTVGQLDNGKKIWILAELNEPPIEIVPGDPVAKYMLLGNGHDGKTSIFVAFTPIRVWCANQFPSLRKNTATQMIRLRHTSRAKVNLDKLRDTINYANAEFNATAEQYRELSRHDFNSKDLEKYVKLIFCTKEEQAKPLKDLSTRKQNQLEEIMSLASYGIELTNPNIRGTWYAAFNGVNQYLNYNAGRNANNRLNSIWFGTNRNLNQKALDVALEMAA